MEQTSITLEYQVAYASLEAESMDRLEQVNSIEIEFLRLFECHVASPQTHPLLVYHIRNMIFAIEDIFQGTKEYFKEMKMDFVYALFRKIQVLMVNGYNFLAQALLGHIKRAELDKEIREDLRNRENVITKITELAKKEPDKARALEHFDYTINFLEMEEEKLKEEMDKIQDHFLLSKELVDKIAPSKAVKQLTEIKERSEITLENSQKIFEQTYQLKYLQFKNYLTTLQHPQDFTRQFCENIKASVKDKFTQGMKKSVNIVYNSVKQNQLNNMIEVSTQTQQEKQKLEKKIHLKHGEKMQNLLVKERKMNQKLQIDIAALKKEIEQWKAEKYKLTQRINELTRKNQEISHNYDALVKLYEERREENAKLIDDIGRQSNCILELRQIEAKYLCVNPPVEAGVQANLLPAQQDQVVDVRLFDQNQTLIVLRRHNERLKQKMAEMEEKQFRSKRALKGDIKTDFKMKNMRLETEPSTAVIHQFHTVSHDYQRKRSSIEHTTSVQLIASRKDCYLPSNLLIHLEGVEEESQKQEQEEKENINMKKSIKKSNKSNKSNKLHRQEENCSKEIQQEQEIDKSILLATKAKVKTAKVTLNEQPTELATPKIIGSPVLVDAETQTLNASFDRPDASAELKRQIKRPSQQLDSFPSFSRGTRINKTLKPSGMRESSLNFQTKRTQSFTINTSKDHTREKSRFNNCKDDKQDLESEEEIIPIRDGHPGKMTREHFENLNIQCEESKNLQKRSILSKNNQFLISSYKNRTEDPHDLKTHTCGEEPFSVEKRGQRQSRRSRKKSQTNIMLVVDRVNPRSTAQWKKDMKSPKKLTAPLSQGWSTQQRMSKENIF